VNDMKVTPLYIGELIASIPIMQGGMGIGVSRSRLASAVAAEGGIGIISGVQIGFEEPDFDSNSKVANIRALRQEIKKAKEAAKGGILGVNLMVAMNNYVETAKVCVEEGIDLIVSGAGLPTELPGIIKDSKTKAVPIVSSGKAAAVLLKLWERRWNYVPDAVVVEGPEAGGHLGFAMEDFELHQAMKLEDIVKEVRKAVSVYETKYNKKISIIAAGGIFDGKDISYIMKQGADGVQMATRFVATEECDADIRYKKAYIDSQQEDILIIKSPVGLPGRAIRNKFISDIQKDRIPVNKCYGCLKTCSPGDTIYCISKALINAVKGNIEDGLIFTGSNAYRLKEIVSVKDLMRDLVSEMDDNI
jgi:nitronate monooxygenase